MMSNAETISTSRKRTASDEDLSLSSEADIRFAQVDGGNDMTTLLELSSGDFDFQRKKQKLSDLVRVLYEEATRLPLSPQEVYIPSDAFTVAYEENQSLLGIVFDIASRINRKQTPEIKDSVDIRPPGIYEKIQKNRILFVRETMLLYLCPNRDPNIHVRACSRPFIKSNKILTTLVCRQEEFSHPYSLLSAEQREELEDQFSYRLVKNRSQWLSVPTKNAMKKLRDMNRIISTTLPQIFDGSFVVDEGITDFFRDCAISILKSISPTVDLDPESLCWAVRRIIQLGIVDLNVNSPNSCEVLDEVLHREKNVEVSPYEFLESVCQKVHHNDRSVDSIGKMSESISWICGLDVNLLAPPPCFSSV